MAKKFFYVCAGVFLLAFSFHLGARSAGAYYDGGFFRIVGAGYVIAGGTVYYPSLSRPSIYQVDPRGLPPVSPSQIVWMSGSSLAQLGSAMVATSDGRMWFRYGDPDPETGLWQWESTPIPGGPTSVRQSSFGQLKVRYRGERSATPVGGVEPQRLRR